MSKNQSHLFEGTLGEKIANAIKPSVQREAVTRWADQMSQALEDVSKRQRDKFRTACVAVDDETGNMYFGRNGGIGRDGDNLHPKLREILPMRTMNNYPTTWNCAESDAINQALHSGVNLSSLHIYTISTAARANCSQNEYGKAKRSCENCTATFKGKIRRNNTGWSD